MAVEIFNAQIFMKTKCGLLGLASSEYCYINLKRLILTVSEYIIEHIVSYM